VQIGGSGSFYGPRLTRRAACSTIRRMPNRLSAGWRKPLNDVEMVTLVTAHGGRAVPGVAGPSGPAARAG